MPYYLAPSLQQLRAQLNAHYPGRDKTSDGWIGDTSHAARPSDHNPDPPPDGVVRAFDIDEDVLGAMVDEGVEPALLVARLLLDERVQYVIYEGRIWNRRYGYWRAYTGVNAHRSHIHVSIRHGLQWEQDTSPWPVTPTPAPPSVEDDMTPEDRQLLKDVQALLNSWGPVLGQVTDLLEQNRLGVNNTERKVDRIATAVTRLTNPKPEA